MVTIGYLNQIELEAFKELIGIENNSCFSLLTQEEFEALLLVEKVKLKRASERYDEEVKRRSIPGWDDVPF
jgi:hypothetical protein